MAKGHLQRLAVTSTPVPHPSAPLEAVRVWMHGARAAKLQRICAVLLGIGALLTSAAASAASCTSGALEPGDGADLEVTGLCTVGAGKYEYRDVNIHSGGTLEFVDVGDKIEFWARSILIENDGALRACRGAGADLKTDCGNAQRFGANGGELTIYLYGKDQGARPFGQDTGPRGVGISCKTPETSELGPCGIEKAVWEANPPNKDKAQHTKQDLPGGVRDYFYQYTPLPYDDGVGEDGKQGYFGYKVLAVSYGGTLQLFGAKGVDTRPVVDDEGYEGHVNSGKSWVRLAGDLKPGDSELRLDRAVDWKDGDRIVVTTTDYLPGHSEELVITQVVDAQTLKVDCVVKDDSSPCVRYFHNGTAYDLSEDEHPGIGRLDLDIEVGNKPAAETRAAVALLSRTIRVLSAGESLGEAFPGPSVLVDSTEEPGKQHPYYFGGHTLARQGFRKYQVQGVEFGQLGQGGRMGRYPVHFHIARRVPDGTFVRDSSIHDSMTRWIVLHATQGVELSRNVGYRSIGHGFYLEEGTETDNSLFANIGISARAAVDNVENPRKVPGILASPEDLVPDIIQKPDYRGAELVPYHSDFDHPTVFWIMNGWNDFRGNMAVGAGTCGVCYWLVPGANSGMSRGQRWEDYASLQSTFAMAATTPLRIFSGNSCSTAMTSFQTVGNTTPCTGIDGPNYHPALPDNPNAGKPLDTIIRSVRNPLAPPRILDLGDPLAVPAKPPTKNPVADDYYPIVDSGGGRFATTCNKSAKGAVESDPATGALDCSRVEKCANGNVETNCEVTVLDRYTSAFHWAETNLGAIWLRPQWYLVTNSVLSDVQNGGLTFVTGGDYTKSSAIEGHWMLVRNSAFIGNTQPTKTEAAAGNAYYNAFADHASPFNPDGLRCDNQGAGTSYCISLDQGISMPRSNFGVMQRMFNIYDGPAQQESNAYLDITVTGLEGCKPTPGGENNGYTGCAESGWMYGKTLGVPGVDGACHLPNAAIGWKQPNGFYYPPSFHSDNLYFNNVDIRHLVIQPLFEPGTFTTKVGGEDGVRAAYCNWNNAMFNNWTDIDRQTVLNDDDGSMTGLAKTISVNLDPFFTGPNEAIQCRSDETAKTSPYQHVTSVIYPGCAANAPDEGTATSRCNAQDWARDCATPECYGVPMYRQQITGTEKDNDVPGAQIRMMQQSLWQRNNMTANNGVYYIDTTVPGDIQRKQRQVTNTNVFHRDEDYYLFLIYATPQLTQDESAYDYPIRPTRQTYQFYVGEGANPQQVEDAVVMVRTSLLTSTLNFEEGDWPSTWRKQYRRDDGILTITLDMGFDEFKANYKQAARDACQPTNFCAWDDSTERCGCSVELQTSDPVLYQECLRASGQSDSVCTWAGRDVDCPAGGCYGIRFTMPGEFGELPDNKGGILQPDGHRPDPRCFRESSEWDVAWQEASEDLAGPECFQPPVQDPPDFCDSRTR